ncbi:NAD kinase 2, chloroplastic [Coffea arabica]|uniref:NAD kinase 2, chloroplastic n=1 Tax=Coffea arabica TaxID=13443 RepID=A0A6P6ULS1_COFAR
MVVWQQQQHMLILHLHMNRVVVGGPTGTHIHNHPLFHYQQPKWTKISGFGFGFLLQRKNKGAAGRRRLRVLAASQLSNSFSLNSGFNSQAIQTRELSLSRWVGPLPGDIAEVEAYCRIFRAAEWFHNALMDTLCNPLTGECNISYDIPSEDKSLLEEKMVSVLGCMVCLLNKGREDVLSGRASAMNSFRESDVNLMEDTLPPLASFRGEMKRYCESLHVALEGYLTPDDARSVDVWRKLQKLKNACYDSGFPRRGDDPCQRLFANWNPVYLSTSKEDTASDSEVAFWRGGQVTEEGLEWLLERGFKTIVDLRAETVKDIFYETKLHEATLSGRIEFVKLPVEVGTAPSMKQVEEFAALLSDSSKRPIYLHSKEGVWRTSALVSRWRHYMARSRSQTVPRIAVTSMDVQSLDTKGMDKYCISQKSEGGMKYDDQNGSRPSKLNETSSSSGEYLNGYCQTTDKQHSSNNGNNSTIVSHRDLEFSINEQGAELPMDFDSNVNPLESQLPPSNIFSKKEMSEFFRNRKLAPLTYFNYERKRLEKLSSSMYNLNKTSWRNENNENYAGYSGIRLSEAQTSNGSFRSNSSSAEIATSAGSDGTYLNGNNSSSSSFMNELSNDNGSSASQKNGFVNSKYELDKKVPSANVTEQRSNPVASVSVGDDGLEVIEGNMCASATGVVRVQSRKKAEMFLVRTDGFSCAREKVTESSLAFTHPSTQQQMLLWKSPPKTVLLLKKLGQELMEEAKEVARFLYYQEEMHVLVEPEVHDIFARIPGFGFVQTFYSQDTSDLHERVDFVACLGGDGVILHASNIFRDAVPPVVSFNLGSLGFLTSHTFEDCKKDLRQVINGNNTVDGVYITLRMRLRCEIFRNGKAMPGKLFDVLNEVVVDRGSNPYLSKIECYEHDRLITKVQGDGVIVATPTGSTAYSTAAGGSMVHPNVPCMLFTPICPHSLSFRPVILPDSARLELKIPEDARSNAWVSFDGKRRQQLSRGDSVRISMSQHPLPTVNKCDQTGDWFHSLIRCLNWNERLDQKAL